MTAEPDAAHEQLLPRALLEEWTVPEMTADMKERVMAQLDEQWRLGGPAPRQVALPPRRSAVTVTTFTAVAALAASVTAVVAGLHHEPPPPSAATSPAPVAVVGHAALGHLTIETTPTDATVEIDGVAVQGPSPYVAANLSVGPHEVRVHRDGHASWTRVVTLPEGQLNLPVVLTVDASDTPAAVHKGDADAKAHVPRAARAPSVKPSGPTVHGAHDRAAIRTVVREHLAEVRSCYHEALADDPTASGRVVVQFTIGPTGRVPAAVVASTTMEDARVGNCIAKAVKRWRFPAPAGGGNVVVTYPFVLEPG